MDIHNFWMSVNASAQLKIKPVLGSPIPILSMKVKTGEEHYKCEMVKFD